MPNVDGLDVLNIYGLKSVDVRDFGEDEKEKFDIAWDRLTSLFQTEGRMSLFDERDKNSAFLMAMCFKQFSGKEFEGANPKTGFGMRWAMPEDVFQAADVIYDHNWATAGRRNWMSNLVMDAGTFEAGTPIVMRDATLQDHWAMLQYGLISGHPSPKVRAFYTEINRDAMPSQYVEMQILASQLHVAKFGNQAYWFGPNIPFKTGLGFEIGALGQDQVRPLAIVFISSTRGLDLTINRPVVV